MDLIIVKASFESPIIVLFYWASKNYFYDFQTIPNLFSSLMIPFFVKLF